MKYKYFFILMFVALGCDKQWKEENGPFETETLRVASPDKKCDFVMTDSRSSVSKNAECIYITPHTAKIDPDLAIFRGVRSKNLSCSWTRSNRMVITYESSSIIFFTNHWSSDDVDNSNYLVEIRLNPTGELSIPK
jgi:hypothetical protein